MFVLKRFLVFIFCCCTVFTISAQNDIGKFDIQKVRNATVEKNDSSLNSLTNENAKKDEPLIFIIFRITFYLALVIALIFGVSWFIKKTGLSKAGKVQNGSMDLLEVLPLGQNRGTMLIRVLDTIYVVGQTPNSLLLIDKIEGQKAIEIIASSKGGTSIVQFKDAFNSFMQKMKKPS